MPTEEGEKVKITLRELLLLLTQGENWKLSLKLEEKLLHISYLDRSLWIEVEKKGNFEWKFSWCEEKEEGKSEIIFSPGTTVFVRYKIRVPLFFCRVKIAPRLLHVCSRVQHSTKAKETKASRKGGRWGGPLQKWASDCPIRQISFFRKACEFYLLRLIIRGHLLRLLRSKLTFTV